MLHSFGQVSTFSFLSLRLCFSLKAFNKPSLSLLIHLSDHLSQCPLLLLGT